MGGLTLVIVGAFTSLLSFDLEGRRRTEDAKVAQQRDADRLKQLIVAGQPSTSLDVEWRFSDVGADIRKSFDEAEARLDRLPEEQEERFKHLYGVQRTESFAFLRRHWQLHPFLQVITGAQNAGSSVVAVIALDDSAASVVPFGVLDYNPTPADKGRFGEASRTYYRKENTKGAAAGVNYHETVDRFFRMSSEPSRTRTSPLAGGSPILTRRGSEFSIVWQVSAAHLEAAVDRVAGGLSTPASLPDSLRIRILILYRLFDLPARPNNFAIPLWRENYFGDPGLFSAIDASAPRVPFGGSTLRIVPNGAQDAAATYDIVPLKRVRIADASPEIREDYCDALVLVGKRRPDAF